MINGRESGLSLRSSVGSQQRTFNTRVAGSIPAGGTIG